MRGGAAVGVARGGCGVSAPLSEQQLAEIAARVEGVRAMKFTTGLNAASGYFDTPVERELYRLAATCWNALQAQLKDSDALLAEATRLRAQVDEMVHAAMGDRKVRLFDEVGEVQNARTIADAQLARANTLDRRCREKNEQLAARTFYLADVEGIDDGRALHTTADAAKTWVDTVGGYDGEWFERDGVWEQWHTDLDTDQPTGRGTGSVMPMMVQGDGILAEAQQIRQGFLERSQRADLLTEVRDSQRDEIRRLQTEQGRIMQALGCGQHDEWDEVVHRARRLAAGGAVSS